MLETLVIVVSIAFTVPVLASSYYSLILLLSSFGYPRSQLQGKRLMRFPQVSILVATYNEKFVISRTLDALLSLDYPKENLQVIVADDSTDATRGIVDSKIEQFQKSGIDAIVSRRATRQGFKSGALNQAAHLLKGQYVLLLDADSTVTPEVLSKGLAAFENHPDLGFVSFRVGHYNRDQSIITRLFALSLDLGDTLTKMGAYAINSPFSFQGGFTLISSKVLKQVGYWSGDSIVDDADLSCKVYSSGKRGIYLSDAKIFGEDPQTLEVWKKQAARVAQGWAKCVSTHWRTILRTPHMSRWRRIALLVFLLGPLSSLSWIVVSFASAFAVAFGVSPAANSIFSNPAYIILVSLPISSYFVSAAYSLWVQKIMTWKNILLLPLLSYTGYCMLTASSVGFVSGLMGRTGFFFRTPKSGVEGNPTTTEYFRNLRFGRVAVVESVLSITALAISVIVMIKGVWFLGLTLLGFGVLTLKSMSLSRLLTPRGHAFTHSHDICRVPIQAKIGPPAPASVLGLAS